MDNDILVHHKVEQIFIHDVEADKVYSVEEYLGTKGYSFSERDKHHLSVSFDLVCWQFFIRLDEEIIHWINPIEYDVFISTKEDEKDLWAQIDPDELIKELKRFTQRIIFFLRSTSLREKWEEVEKRKEQEGGD